MTTYYVKNGGSDGADGLSDDNAWETVGKVNSESFSAGDIVSFNRGDTWRDTTLDNSSVGTSGNPITYTAYGTGTDPTFDGADDLITATYRWIASGSGTNEWYVELAAGGDPSISDPVQVFLDGTRLSFVEGTLGAMADHEWAYGDNDTLGFSTIYLCDATGDPDSSGITFEATQRAFCWSMGVSRYITVDNIIFERGGTGIRFVAFSQETQDVIVQNCTARFCADMGIHALCTSKAGINISYLNNIVHDCGNHGINNFTDTENVLIDGNEVYNCSDNDGGQRGAIKSNENESLEAGGLTITNNYVHDNFSYGIWPDTPKGTVIIEGNISRNNLYGIFFEFSQGDAIGSRISYNLLYENEKGGVIMVASAGISILNNTCYNPDAGSFGGNINVFSDARWDTDDCIVKNNICSGGSRLIVIEGGGANDGLEGTGNVYENNMFHPVTTNSMRWDAAQSTVAAWESASSGAAVNNIDGDPLFSVPANNNFRLQRESPAIDAGVDVSLTQDYEGNSLVGLPDIGAYEYAVGITKPIAANLVNNLTSNLTASLPE